MNSALYLKEMDNGTLINIAVKPNSKKQDITVDESCNYITVSLKSPPDKGKANKELVKLLGEILEIPSSNIEIIKGKTSRDKQLIIYNISIKEIKERIMDYQC